MVHPVFHRNPFSKSAWRGEGRGQGIWVWRNGYGLNVKMYYIDASDWDLEYFVSDSSSMGQWTIVQDLNQRGHFEIY